MNTTLSTLLLITSCVMITCVVVDYAVTIVQNTMQTTNIPQLDKLKQIEQSLLNQTDTLWNQTLSQPDTLSLIEP